MIAHDITNVPRAPVKSDCCQDNGKLTKSSKKDSSCVYIPIPSNDQIHAGEECMDFFKSLNDQDVKCKKSKKASAAQQINEATAFLDLSPVYGTNLKTSTQLRSLKNGELKITQRHGVDWPPQPPLNENVCIVESPCYLGGDPRLNQSPLMSIIHILFVREHNRIANVLSKLNPKWNDEILFQEARRINIAQYQNIVYYEWFGGFFGERGLKGMGLFYKNSGDGYAKDYSSSIDPTVLNEFSAAIFRIPHNLINGQLK